VKEYLPPRARLALFAKIEVHHFQMRAGTFEIAESKGDVIQRAVGLARPFLAHDQMYDRSRTEIKLGTREAGPRWRPLHQADDVLIEPHRPVEVCDLNRVVIEIFDSHCGPPLARRL